MTISTSTTKLTTKCLVLIALVTALTCILAPFSIPLPFSPVPITLTNLVLYISIYILGWKHASISYLVYLLLGIVGLPVFSGFSGGLFKVAGPTGGYLVGFIFLIPIAGLFISKWQNNRSMAILGMALGTLVTYAFGTIWLSQQLHLTFIQGLAVGVFPYLPFDILKIIIAVMVGPSLRNRIRKTML